MSPSNRNRKRLIAAALLAVAMLIISGCATAQDWKPLYSAQLNRTVVDLDESFINREFKDDTEGGSLTRVAWAKLDDGTMVFLGLPPHGTSQQDMVGRTVVLAEEEWKTACGEASGEQVTAWTVPQEHRGNAIRVYPNNRTDAYCEFYYLPRGWELRTVQVNSVLKPFQ